MGKYEEALERARQGMPIDEVFPELKESEDEKIMDDIMVAVENSRLPYERIEEIRFYLNNQKEQKDNRFAPRVFPCSAAWFDDSEEERKEPIPDKFSGLKSILLQYLQSAANRKDDAEIESDTDLWGRKILDYVWKCEDEKQKEPKYTNSENPKEWSEEDEKMIDDIIGALTKMAESEDNILPEILPSVARKYVKRLKSLRPHWKPSKEQMNELFQALIPGRDYDCDVLQGLHDDLVKLMEGKI